MKGAATERIVDADERARALDVTRSFIVQAPAGSGKTGLLVQRFLALLARVERPEAVLAITFTRKAAGEMRRRIVEALLDASRRSEPPEADFERQRHALAKAVLDRDAEKGWGLLHSPSRLQVFTIDGFCSRVAASTPLLSRLGSTPGVVQDASPLYREAVRRTLSPGGRAGLRAEMEILLERYEMGLDRLEGQLVEMLSCRDQWSEGVLESRHDEDAWVDDVESAFFDAIGAEVASIAHGVEPGLVARIHDLAVRSREVVGDERCAWPTLGGEDRLGSDASAASAWKQAAALLLKGGELRKVRGKHEAVYGTDKELTADFRALLEEFAGLGEARASRWLELLRSAEKLPSSPEFSPEGRAALRAFLAVLRHAFVELWNVFRSRREVDYVEIAMRAVGALRPGETLEKLDARVEHILVDEFQDTNVLQCELLRGLTMGWTEDDGRTLFLVGDPMQSIYRFRKAEVGLFLAARSSPRFLGSVVLDRAGLGVNFRSSRSVVEWVNSTFSVLLGDRDDATRSLVAFAAAAPKPGAAEGTPVEVVLWTDRAPSIHESDDPKKRKKVETERRASAAKGVNADLVEACGLADWIARETRAEIERRDAAPVKAVGHSTPPIAVLVRARSHALPLLRALERRAPEVRVRAPGLDRLGDRASILDLEALTRALLHAGDRLSHLAVLRSPWVGLTLEDLARLVETDVAAASSSRNVTAIPMLLRDEDALVAPQADGRPRVSEDGRRRIARWVAIADAAQAGLSSRPLDVVVRSAWLRLGGPATGSRLEALDAEIFFELLASRVRGGSVDLDDLALAVQNEEAAVDADAEADVEIMTMHKAKGLEFDTVILPGLGRATSGSNPLPLAMETEPDSGRLRLVAPRGARGREDTDSDKHAFLEYRESRRGNAESLRLLYVAATRAKRRLLLSAAEGRLNKDGNPSSRSLLAALGLTMDIGAARIEAVVTDDAPRTKAMSRLATGAGLRASAPSIADRSITSESPSAMAEVAPEFFAEGRTSAFVGLAYHAFVERIASEGLEAWPVSRVADERVAIEHRLRSEGVLAAEMEDAVAKVSSALVATLEDEKGRWILSSHEQARSEWQLQSLNECRMTSAVIDRTFVADGARWIVDFKTGAPPSGDRSTEEAVNRYVADKCEGYALQLARYRDLLLLAVAGQGGVETLPGLHGDLPIRLALFFPQLPAGHRWQDITDAAGLLP